MKPRKSNVAALSAAGRRPTPHDAGPGWIATPFVPVSTSHQPALNFLAKKGEDLHGDRPSGAGYSRHSVVLPPDLCRSHWAFRWKPVHTLGVNWHVPRFPQGAGWRYAIALVGFLLSFFLREVLSAWLHDRDFVVFVPAIILIAFFADVGPAILTTLLSGHRCLVLFHAAVSFISS